MRAIAALVLLALLGGCAASTGSGVGPRAIVVATWNLHHGEGLDGKIDVDRIGKVLRESGAELIALQEVDVGVARSGRIDLAGELATRLGMHVVFGKNIDYQGGEYGNAILSRWPIQSSENLHYRMLREGEQRGLLVARVATPHGLVVFAATHIDWRPDDAERVSNVAEIGARASTESDFGPVVVCGDMNDLPGSRVHSLLLEDFADAWTGLEPGDDGFTYPAAAPVRRIDWILLHRRAALRVERAAVIDSDASDHRLVLAELRW